MRNPSVPLQSRIFAQRHSNTEKPEKDIPVSATRRANVSSGFDDAVTNVIPHIAGNLSELAESGSIAV